MMDRTLVLAHSTSSRHWEKAYKKLSDQGIGWIYITNGILPNP